MTSTRKPTVPRTRAKTTGKPGTVERPVARKPLMHAGIIFDPGEQLLVAPDEVPVVHGRPRPLNIPALVAEGLACDGSCGACDCAG